MPLDQHRVAEARAWLERAHTDLDSSDVLLAADPPRVDTSLFHCQQAAEKSWKALLFWRDVPFRKTHDLRQLGEACVGLDGSLAALAGRAEDLTPFAWLFRYPGDSGAPAFHEAREALEVAREVYEAVLSRLPAEVRPQTTR